MFEVLLAKLAGAGIVAKTSVAAGALALSGSAAAVSGSLPPPVQAPVATAAERVLGLEIPGGERADAENRRDGEATDSGSQGSGAEAGSEDVGSENSTSEPAGAGDEFGTWVSNMAESGYPQDQVDGPFGGIVSRMAQTLRPSGTPTGDNPGSDAAEVAPAGAPSETPSAETNPSSGFRS